MVDMRLFSVIIPYSLLRMDSLQTNKIEWIVQLYQFISSLFDFLSEIGIEYPPVLRRSLDPKFSNALRYICVTTQMAVSIV